VQTPAPNESVHVKIAQEFIEICANSMETPKSGVCLWLPF